MARIGLAASHYSNTGFILDFIGIGFGPSNLALAVAAREIDARKRGIFFERQSSFDWHPGLLFDSSRMQISFLKDLATLRNPASPFSFLQYAKAKGRLERFVNLNEFHPTRFEYRDYLRWVADAFADQVCYGWEVRKITPVRPDAENRYSMFEVHVQNLASGQRQTYLTRNVVYAAGGKPRYPANTAATDDVIHSGEFLHRFPQRYADHDAARKFGVIGDGQSAGEILLYLLQHYPKAEVHVFLSGYALRPVDRSAFVNEAFFSSEMEVFHDSSEARRALLRQQLRNTNYGVVAPELIDRIYQADYLDDVAGVKRLFMHSFCKLAGIAPGAPGAVVTVEDRCTGQTMAVKLDGAILATGYERHLDADIFADLLPGIHTDERGVARVSRNFRVQTEPHIAGGIYVQGYAESSHGLGDTLLSLLPFRSRDIFNELCRCGEAPQVEPARSLPLQRLRDVEYPPQRHLESDPQKLYAVLEHCKFATLICAVGDEPVVTQLPLILDRSRGPKGILFGHMDRSNPHVELLQGHRALALFHGPNAYISPHVYETNQLPTWNSITVQVRGGIRLISDRDTLLRGLASISATDTRPGAYRLDLNHPAIERILDYIVGFEIQIEELIGRFKLSQDRNVADRKRAAMELARQSEAGERALIEYVLDYSPQPAASAAPLHSNADHDPLRCCIHELFEAQALRTPHAPAIFFQDEQLSYGELNDQANRLAYFLRQLGAGPETIVGLCLERSPRQMVALLGILKSGAAFVPIDPDFPEQRREYMLRQTACAVLVTQARFQERFRNCPARIVCVDSDWPDIAAAPAENLNVLVDAQNLAYCIYTSGSTGQPKAVAIPHRGLVNHVLHVKRALRHSDRDRVLQFTAITADGSLQEIFTAWLSGAALVLPTQQAPSVRNFMQMLSRHQVSVVSVPTAYWHFWVGEMSTSDCDWPQSVRLVILGGEKVIPEKLRQWQKLACTRNVAWVQDYGPTETTVSCTAFEAGPADGADNISIGRPNSNMQIYMLDDDGNPTPAGVPGELCIAGPGLARGYLRRPELTAEKFVPNPFGEPGTRLYRTGDLARYLPDGNIQFLGRRDEQVKIMGHRIELGEIESALLRCPGVRQAVVLARENKSASQQLFAFLVADAFDEGSVRRQLAAVLPAVMMPAAFMIMPELPATSGGKVDRKRLLAMDTTGIAPTLQDATSLQQGLAQWWTNSTGRPPRSIDEDFLLAGGDSLRALSLLNRIAALTGIEIGLADFFAARTLRSLAALLKTMRCRSTPSGEPAALEQILIRQLTTDPLQFLSRLRRNDTQRQPAANAQQRLWFLDRLQQGAATYSVPLAYRIIGALDIERLDRCLTALVARHEALRTALVMTTDNELWQQIAAPVQIRSQRREAASFEAAMQLARIAASQPFDLAKPPLLHSLCVQSGQETVWLLVLHHSVCDAWSVAILWRELMALYDAIDGLPLPQFQYADYARWQREWLASADAAAQRTFWRAQLAGELPSLQLGDRPVPDAERSTAGAMQPCPIDETVSRAVRDTAERHGTTEFVVVLSAFLATLQRYTRQDEIVIGVPVACRSLPETEHIVGYFTNTLPLRVTFAPHMRFADLLHQTAQSLADVLAHQELPFDEIVAGLETTRQGSDNPLFQAMFVMQTTPLDAAPRLGKAHVEEILVHSGTAKVDVTCSIRKTARGLEGELEYALDVLNPTAAQRLVECFLCVLSAATQDAASPVAELSMLRAAERDGLILRANSRRQSYPDFLALHVHFENQALARPAAIAVECADASIGYGELNTQANRLARRLQRSGVGHESLVGICMDRSIDMAVALLAVLKAGAGFVPLDPGFPMERIQAIVDDAHLRWVLTQARHVPRFADAQLSVLVWTHEAVLEAETNLDTPIHPDGVAYIYYTSGSTGTPKGVVLTHRGAMNRLEWLRWRYPLQPGNRVVQQTPLIFDLAIWEVFGPLLAGATVLMAAAGAESDVAHMGTLLSSPGTAFVYFVPSMLEAYLNYAARRSYPDLQWVCVTGEALPARLLERFGEHFSAQLQSTYGQTETSEVAVWEGSTWSETANVPAGRPIGIYRLYVLDAALNPVPPGVPGEICVAGIGGLARGYHGQPALTAEKFVPHPYAIVPGERLYRTGDLGRLREDGIIEYVGRTDQQVKIRGCRVETAEVEAILSRHPAVRSCTVSVRTDTSGDAQLVAYVVSDRASANELGAHAEKLLPHYMLPAAYVFLDDLPLTATGKLDRSRLPAPRHADFEARAAHESAQSDLEVELAEVWKQVLGLQSVGRGDNFFSLGGNSLKSIQVIARLKDNFSVDISVRDFFAAPTIAGLAGAIERALVAYVASLSEAEAEQRLALSSQRIGETVQ